MGYVIKSWDVDTGQMLQLGNHCFSDAEIASLRTDAIRTLCKKALESSEGSRFATERLVEDGQVQFTVGFTKERGLWLDVNGKELEIATADEVFQGKNSYLEEIKKIAAVAERHGLGVVYDETSLPVRTESVNKVYNRVMQAKQEEENKPTLIDRLRNKLDISWGVTDTVSAIRNSAGTFAPAAVTFHSILAFAGGILLAIAGVHYSVTGANEMGSALRFKDFEKLALSLLKQVAGTFAVVFGILYTISVSTLVHVKNAVLAAGAGAIMPFFLFPVYIALLAASIYKIYEAYKFRRELQSDLETGNDPEKYYAAIMRLCQLIRRSELEDVEHCKSKETKELNFSEKMYRDLYNKCERFSLRAGGSVKTLLEGILQPEEMDKLLRDLKNGDGEAIAKAKDIVDRVLQANRSLIKWNIIGSLTYVLGLITMGVWLGTTGTASSIAVSAMFAVAAVVSIFVDIEKARDLPKKAYDWVRSHVNIRFPFDVCNKTSTYSFVNAALELSRIANIIEEKSEEQSRIQKAFDTMRELFHMIFASKKSCVEPNVAVEVESCTSTKRSDSWTTLDLGVA